MRSVVFILTASVCVFGVSASAQSVQQPETELPIVIDGPPPGSSMILAQLPLLTGTSYTVVSVPIATYDVSMVAVDAAGQSAESDPVTVNVTLLPS